MITPPPPSSAEEFHDFSSLRSSVCNTGAAQKIKCSIKDFFSKCDQIRRKLLLKKVTFTEEILNGKLLFLCSVVSQNLPIPFF